MPPMLDFIIIFSQSYITGYLMVMVPEMNCGSKLDRKWVEFCPFWETQKTFLEQLGSWTAFLPRFGEQNEKQSSR